MTNEERQADAAAWWHSFKWPAIVAVLLAGHVVIVTGALLLSSTWIPGASSTPRELGDQLRWDDLQALRRASEQLGWTLEVAPTGKSEINGDRELEFVLRDDNGTPIRDAALQVAMYHHSRPNRPIELAFEPDPKADGHLASLDIDREGAWRVSAMASRGAERFLIEADFWVGDEMEGLQ
ncbi:MAG: FixH family protein [Planctomycetota bacterium]